MPSALLIGGCGGGGDSDGLTAGEQDQIRTVLINTQTTADPAHCTEDYTDNLVANGGGLEACQKFERQGGQPDSIDIQSLDGTHAEAATAHVVAHGGNFEGYGSTIGLVYEEGRWKIDDFNLEQKAPAGGGAGA